MTITGTVCVCVFNLCCFITLAFHFVCWYPYLLLRRDCHTTIKLTLSEVEKLSSSMSQFTSSSDQQVSFNKVSQVTIVEI
jgi:hypothetical protein